MDFIYSGIVQRDDIPGKDYIWVRIQKSVDDGKTLLIQSTAHLPVKFEMRLREDEVRDLYVCLYNALRAWDKERKGDKG